MTDASDESLTKLVQDFINSIRTAFDRDLNVPASADSERVRIAEGLFAVHDLIAQFPGLGPRFAKPFGDLGRNLQDINSAAVHPLFRRPDGVPHRDTSEIWCARANIVFAVNAIIESDRKSVRAAAAEVIGWHRKVWGSSEEAKRTLINWRKEFSAGRVKNDMANELYNVGSKFIQHHMGDPAFLRTRAKDRAKAASEVDGVFS
jgi:hypothetical protein